MGEIDSIKVGNLSLLVDLYELTMAQSYYEHLPNAYASFDLFIRRLPPNRSYFVFAGLEDVIHYLKGFSFTVSDINYLKSLDKFSSRFLDFLGRLRFTGDLWAIPEGTVFFPNEPILRITGPLIQIQLLESFLLNVVNIQTMVATKASRIVISAGKLPIYDFSLRRCQGWSASLKVARASYIAGCKGTSNVLAGKIYNIPVVGTMAHSFVMSFENEETSFWAYARTFPKSSILLVDTYNLNRGIKNAIGVAKELKKRGYSLVGIRLDSGNLASDSKLARRMLDSEGLYNVKIMASGDLDEYMIKKLLDEGAKIDGFGVGTHMGVSEDAPFCDVVYKLCEIARDGKTYQPAMKLSRHKLTYPGRKQIFRQYTSSGRLRKDIIGLECERVNGRPVLVKIFENGRLIYRQPDIARLQQYAREEMERLPPRFHIIKGSQRSPISISNGLNTLTRRLKNRLKDIQ